MKYYMSVDGEWEPVDPATVSDLDVFWEETTDWAGNPCKIDVGYQYTRVNGKLEILE